MILRIKDTARGMYTYIQHTTRIEIENIDDEEIDTNSIENLKFSEVINKYGYVYNGKLDILYVDTDNTYKLYTNYGFIEDFINPVKECITQFLIEYRDDDLNILID